jgi:hypothetical protein
VSINIGAKAHNAAVSLRGNRDFETLVEGLGELAQTFMQASMRSPPEVRTDTTSHARGLYDVWLSLEAALRDVNPRNVDPRKPTRESTRS